MASLILIVAAITAYWNSFDGGFVYDDFEAIRDNPHIRRLWPLSEAMSLDEWNSGKTVDCRPILSLSFALNYALLGGEPWSYHVGNLLIHVLNALVLYAIVHKTMRDARLRPLRGTTARQAGCRIQDRTDTEHRPVRRSLGGGGTLNTEYSSEGFALAVALLWVVHPLTTGAVTYISQRAESLVAFWYLLTLYAAIRGMSVVRGSSSVVCDTSKATPGQKNITGPREAHSSHYSPFTILSSIARRATEDHHSHIFWYSATILCCALGMASKEVMASAPIVVYLYDVVFVSGSFKAAWHERRRLYLGLAATWILLGAIIVLGGATAAQDIRDVNPIRYLFTQPGVILHYLRLSAWPHPLVLHYNWPLADSFATIVPATLVLLLLMGVSAWGLRRKRWYGFLGACFFLVLAPSSSLFPCQQRAFEHRMYIPLMVVLMLLVAGTGWLLRRVVHGRTRTITTVALVALATVALASGTHLRNKDYRSEISLWRSNIRVRPQSQVAHYNLGCALRRIGRTADAMQQFKEAIAIKTDYAEAHHNLAVILRQQGHLGEAVRHCRIAIESNPRYYIAYNNLGSALNQLGRYEEAIVQFRKALEYDPGYDTAHNNWGNALMKLGRTSEAEEHYRDALKINPKNALAHYNWGNALAQQGEWQNAIAHFEAAVRLDPDNAQIHLNLATALDIAGRKEDAERHYARAEALKSGAGSSVQSLRPRAPKAPEAR